VTEPVSYQAVAAPDASSLFSAKTELLENVLFTNRGERADSSMRGIIEEHQVRMDPWLWWTPAAAIPWPLHVLPRPAQD
jgi:hypothetical protein